MSDTQVDIHEVQRGMISLEEQRINENKGKLLDWLSPITMHDKQQDTFSRRQKGTGEWLLEAPVFLDWLENGGSDPILWCHGHPGAGKTIMSSIVIDHLQQRFKDSDVGVAFFYLDYKEERTALDVLSSITRQFSELLWNQHPNLVRVLDKLHSSHGYGSSHLKFQELRTLLSTVCGENPQMFVVIDALDECAIAKERALVLSIMKELCGPSVRVLFTGRPNYDDINTYLADHSQIDIIASSSDIRTYLSARMTDNVTFLKRIASAGDLQAQIVTAIENRASGMFLMAVLQLDRILTERTVTKILKALESFPSKLEDTFQETLNRIRSQAKSDSALGIKILQWLSRSKRPLMVNELRHALAVEWVDGDDPPTVFDSNNVLDPESLLDVCGGLVFIEPTSQIIKLAHFTLEEYFRNTTTALPDGDLEISRTCVAYLCFDAVVAAIKKSAWTLHGMDYSKYRNELDNLSRRFPFLVYACCYWGDHVRELRLIKTELETHCLRILKCETLAAAICLIMSRERHEPLKLALEPNEEVTGMHVLVLLGLQYLAQKLLETGVSVDIEDNYDSTALHWATLQGDEGYAKFLLEIGAKVDVRQKFGHTPLHIAAVQGHEGIARLLLENGAKVDCRDRMLQTPLHKATQQRHNEISRLLLQHGANVNVQDWPKSTPLEIAVMAGNEEITNLLLEHGAQVDVQSEGGMTALAWAVSYRKKNLIPILLKAGASKELVNTRYADESLVQLLESWKPNTV